MIDARAFGPHNAIQNLGSPGKVEHGTPSSIPLSGRSNYIARLGESVFKFYLTVTRVLYHLRWRFIVAPLRFPMRGGRKNTAAVVSIPVSRFHELSRANRGGAAAKVIRRRNDSLSAIPGYYGRNQFQMTHSRAHLGGSRKNGPLPPCLPRPPPLAYTYLSNSLKRYTRENIIELRSETRVVPRRRVSS